MAQGVGMSAQPKDDCATDSTVGAGASSSHQALRRVVNESISVLKHQITQPELIDVICECVHMNCTEHVSMTVASYDALRRFPTRFVVKAGHEVAESERIVSEAAQYIVVEKIGTQGIYAVRNDPRRPQRSVMEVGT
jgi:hypothetical protein